MSFHVANAHFAPALHAFPQHPAGVIPAPVIVPDIVSRYASIDTDLNNHILYWSKRAQVEGEGDYTIELDIEITPAIKQQILLHRQPHPTAPNQYHIDTMSGRPIDTAIRTWLTAESFRPQHIAALHMQVARERTVRIIRFHMAQQQQQQQQQ